MTKYWSVQQGFIMMVVCMVTGLLLSYFGGMILDTLYAGLENIGINGGAGTAWDTTRPINIFINLFYAVCYGLPLIGVAIFGLSLTRRNRYDSSNEYSYYEDPADYGQDRY